jgi:hypothetical protein
MNTKPIFKNSIRFVALLLCIAFVTVNVNVGLATPSNVIGGNTTTFTVTPIVKISPAGAGFVSVMSPSNVVENLAVDTQLSIQKDSELTLKAVAKDGYKFLQFTDVWNSGKNIFTTALNPETDRYSDNDVVTAVFTPINNSSPPRPDTLTIRLIISPANAGLVKIESIDNTVNTSTNGNLTIYGVSVGNQLRFESYPGVGYGFGQYQDVWGVNMSKNYTTTQNPWKDIMEDNDTVTVVFHSDPNHFP